MQDFLHFLPEESVLIGDTIHDFEVAEAVGMKCILVSHGHQYKDRLKAAGVPVIQDFSEIAKHIN